MERPIRQNELRKRSTCTLVLSLLPKTPTAKPKLAQITSFMRPKQNWMKEGLLEHIIELIIAEDKVSAYISAP